MRADVKRKIVLFFFGLFLVSILTALGTIAFIGPHATSFVRNIVITDVIFIALFTVWAKVNKNYEASYKSELSHEHEQEEEK